MTASPRGTTPRDPGTATPRRIGADAALGAVVVIGACVALGLHLAVVRSGGVTGLDRAVATVMLSVRRPALVDLASTLTQLGGTPGLTLLTTVVLGLLALRRRSWEPVVVGAVAGAGSAALTSAVKALTVRPRPPMADAVLPQLTSHAFPSGHSLSSLAVAGIVAYLLTSHRSTGVSRLLVWTSALLFAVVIAATRLYLGRHWATDVLAAWGLGAAWLALVIYLNRRFLRRGGSICADPAPDGPRY